MSKAAVNAIVYGLMGVLVAILIVYMIPVKCHANGIQEGFQNPKQSPRPRPRPRPNTNTKCPTGTRTFTDHLGNLSCCKGQVNGQTCEGSIVCSFSSNAGKNIPICSA